MEDLGMPDGQVERTSSNGMAAVLDVRFGKGIPELLKMETQFFLPHLGGGFKAGKSRRNPPC